MYKHKLSKKKKKRLKHKRKIVKEEKKKKRRVRLNTLNKSFPSLILTVPLGLHKPIVISNVELNGLGPEKILIK